MAFAPARALLALLALLALAAPPSPPAEAPASPAVEAIGVVRSPAPGRSVAILASEGRTRVVAVGESAFGARLVAIGPDGVTLEVEGRRVEKRLTSGALRTDALPPPPAPPAASAPGDPPEDPTTPHREMDRDAVQSRLGIEMNRILSETAMVPVMEDGRVNGVQITRIAEGSLLTDAGLRAGDVLTRVNDTDIDGMATLIGLWPRLQGASELRAVVLRNGQPVSLVLTLR